MSSSKRVLLTGANGYLAQHILSQFLEAGHSVRGVVRSESRVAQLQSSFSAYSRSQLDFAVVPDITVPGAFDEALRSDPPFEVVVHTASPFNYRQASAASADSKGDDGKPEDNFFLGPAIRGTTEVLRGIRRVAAGSVRRVVLTSSIAAVLDWRPENPKITDPRRVYTGADWNLTTLAEVQAKPGDHGIAYRASKTLAERAAWEIAAEEKQHADGFDLVTLCPPMIYGPVFDARPLAGRPADLNQSTWNIYNGLMRRGLTARDPVPATHLHLYVDVRDAARAHLLAAETPAAGGRRMVVCAGEMTFQRMANVIRDTLPARRDAVPEGSPAEPRMPEGIFTASSEEAERVLGLTFHSPESTIGDLALQLAEIEAGGQQ